MSKFSLGQRLRELRMKKGLTQIELAKGISTPSMVSQIESDRARPSYDLLTAYAQRLEVPLEKLLKDVHLDLERSAKFKMAMGMIGAREFRSAIPLLEELAVNPGTTFTRKDVLFELITALLETGEEKRAAELLGSILNHAEGHLELSERVRAYLLYGEAAFRRKEYPLALFHTNRALDELSKGKKIDPHMKAVVLTKLATIHQMIGKVDDAAALYSEALSIAEEHETLEARGKMFLQLAEGFYKQKNYEKADELSTKALILLKEVEAQGAVADWKRNLILLMQHKHAWEETAEQLVSIANLYEERKDKDRAGETYADLAAIYLEHSEGNANILAEAWAFAEKALLILPHTHHSLGKAHQVLAFVYFARMDEENGRQHYQKAVALFEHHGMLAELEGITMKMMRYLDEQGQCKEALHLLSDFHCIMVQRLHERGIVL